MQINLFVKKGFKNWEPYKKDDLTNVSDDALLDAATKVRNMSKDFEDELQRRYG